MDEIDIKISYELFFNGRMPYRELAERMGLSSIAVHKRVQNLIDIGIIRGFRAGLNLRSLGGVVVAVCGWSRFEDFDDMARDLQKDGRTYKVIRSPGGFLFVEGALKDIAELDDYSKAVRSICDLKDARVLIPHVGGGSPPRWTDLTSTDRSIIRELRDDCRRPLSDVAQELNVSTRTVKRRLDRLMENGMVDLRAEMVPTASGDIISFMFMDLKEDADRDVTAHRIWKDNYPRVMSIIPLSNEPGLLIGNCWAGSMKATESLKKELLTRYPIEKMDLNVLYDMQFLETWVDRELLQ
jgi:DNA-binding Lrp family transcriptional regulator